MVDAADSSELEAERILTGLSRGRFGGIAPERIARHVCVSQPDADWPVRKAAFDALVRRYGFAQRDGLSVSERPEPGPLGTYRTASQPRGSGEKARPYETALYRLEPLEMSCACPDFVRSSLGVCKHGLVVLELLDRQAAAGSGERRGLLGGERLPRESAVAEQLPDVRWQYAQNAAGPFDRLLRLYARRPIPGWVDGRPTAAALADLAQRSQLIDALAKAIASGELTAEPAVSSLLAEEKLRCERLRELAPHAPAALASVAGLSRSLYPYQLEGLSRFLQQGRLLLADDMGLGKTTQAIAACHALMHSGAIRRALLIVPTPLKSQWQREWQSTSDVPLWLVEGSPRERKHLYRSTEHGALVLGYEQLLRDLEHVQGFAPELVIVDEAQRIKNWATKSAAYVKSLAPAYRLVLTGTPLENRFDELASIMDFVDDLALEPKWRLLPFHSIVQPGEKASAGARHLDVLRARLSQTMLRRTRGEVLTQLPSRTDTRVPVEMTEAQRARHDELRQPIAELSARAERRALGRGELMRLMQLLTMQRMICNGLAQVQFESEWPRCQDAEPTPALLESLFAPKLSVLRGLIEQLVIAQGRKVVVFSQWRKFLCFAEWAVRDVLRPADKRALFFTGAESKSARERALSEFTHDPLASVLFASDAGAVGLNLQHAASSCINLELPWNPALLEQRIGRIHRLGQTEPCDIYNLVTEDGIEGRIGKLLENKQALFSALFDGQHSAVMFRGRKGLLADVKQLIDPWPKLLDADASAELDATSEAIDAPLTDARAHSGKARSEPKAPEPSALERLGIALTTLPDGSLRIEAPAAVAPQLSVQLEKWAAKFRPRGG